MYYASSPPLHSKMLHLFAQPANFTRPMSKIDRASALSPEVTKSSRFKYFLLSTPNNTKTYIK